jgi:hypothetical protein
VLGDAIDPLSAVMERDKCGSCVDPQRARDGWPRFVDRRGKTLSWSQRSAGSCGAGRGSPVLLGLLAGGHRRGLETATTQFALCEEDGGGPLDPR